MDLDKKDIESIITLFNNRPIDDFEGFSSTDMTYILYEPFSKGSPLQIMKNIPTSILDQIPFLNQIMYFLGRLNDIGELKLTAKGFLPTTLVKDIYDKGFIKDPEIEHKITKLYAETSSNPVHLTRLITELSGFTKKKYNKLSLTKTCKDKLLKKNKQDIFIQIFSTFAQKFNWGYFDGYSSQQTGQLGIAFSLYLLSKYGDTEKQDSFYSEKYLKAFPSLIGDFKNDPWTKDIKKDFNSCYSLRTFDRFLVYFNLIDSRTEGRPYLDSKKFIKKTSIFDKIIVFN